MATNIRDRLRSATRSDGVASEDDSRRFKPTSAAAHRGGSEPGSACRRPSAPKPTRHASTICLTELFDTETDGEEMTVAETPEEVYAKSMRWMEEVFPGVPKEQMESTAPERAADVPADGVTDEAVKEISPPKEKTDGEKLSYWGERLCSKFNEPVQQKYSWTGRSQYAAPGVMEDRLPLNPAIQEYFVEDDVGVWVTFDVPKGHLLHEKFVPVDRTRLPAHMPVMRVQGTVMGGDKPGVDQLREAVIAAHNDSLRTGLSAPDRPTPKEKAKRAAEEKPKEDDRDAQLMSLREELAKAKAALKDSAHKPTAGGDAHAATLSHKKSIRYDTAVTSAIDTDVEIRNHLMGRSKKKEGAYSEYTTCAEEHPDEYVGADGRVYRRRRKSLAERRSRSRSATPDAEIGLSGTKELMQMFQECMKNTLATVLEVIEKPPKQKSNEAGTLPHCQTQTTASPMTVDSPREMPTQMNAAYNPMMAGHPHLTISKFTGENWTEFIEYFESVADANAWSQKDRLTYLLMSIDSKPRMYARGDSGTQQTYHDVRRRLQQRYGQNEPAFSVRAQLREIRREPGERLEVFADRLQEVAQRGILDPQDRDELFYFAFLNAVKDTPKMQNYIEKAHLKNRNLKLSDLLALSQEYLNRSPTALRRTVAVNVCRQSKPSQRLIKTEEEGEETDSRSDATKHIQPLMDVPTPATEPQAESSGSVVAGASAPSIQEIEEHIHKRLNYLNREVDFVKNLVKGDRLRGAEENRRQNSAGGRRRDADRGRRGSQDSRYRSRPGGYRQPDGTYAHAVVPDAATQE